MGLFILVAMIAVPIIEIAVFIQAGDLIGLWPTLATVVLTAIVGTALLRRQGLAALRRVQESLEAGRPPVAELFDGLCLLVAGALLLTPGFVTDGFGLLLFAPPFRKILLGVLSRRIIAGGHVHMRGGPGGRGEAMDTTIIEGEFHEVRNGEKDPSATPDTQGNDLPPPAGKP